MQTWNVCLKKFIHVKIILKDFIQRNNLSIRLLAIHRLHIIHLMQQKIILNVTEAMIVWKRFCKDLRDDAMRIVNYEKNNTDN